MSNENINLVKKHIDNIAKISCELLENEQIDVDIHSDVYRINQEVHKLKILINQCSTGLK